MVSIPSVRCGDEMQLSKHLRVRLSPEDMRRAETLADVRQATVSDVVRDLIRSASSTVMKVQSGDVRTSDQA